MFSAQLALGNDLMFAGSIANTAKFGEFVSAFTSIPFCFHFFSHEST